MLEQKIKSDKKVDSTIKVEVEQELPQQFPYKYIGQFSVTHYCNCKKCTGTSTKSKTATGHIPRKGRTIAVDPKKIPLHSIVYVENIGYFVAEDVGGGVKGNHLDIYVESHDEALKLGTLQGKKVKVYLMKV